MTHWWSWGVGLIMSDLPLEALKREAVVDTPRRLSFSSLALALWLSLALPLARFLSGSLPGSLSLSRSLNLALSLCLAPCLSLARSLPVSRSFSLSLAPGRREWPATGCVRGARSTSIPGTPQGHSVRPTAALGWGAVLCSRHPCL